MKTRRFIPLCALLATLMVSGIPAIAEESGGGVGSVLSGTTIGGYVDSSVGWQLRPTPDTPHFERRGWWRKFFHWLELPLRT